jgi:hypothetical protein
VRALDPLVDGVAPSRREFVTDFATPRLRTKKFGFSQCAGVYVGRAELA